MKRLVYTTLYTFILLVFGLVVSAQEERRNEQPIEEVFQAEIVYPQEKGEFQFDFTSKFDRGKRKGFSNNIALEYGITNSWQVGVEWDAFTRKRNDDGLISRGMGDVYIGTKYSFMNIRGSHFHSAVGFEMGLPSGNAEKEPGEGVIEYEPYVVFAKDFPGQNKLQLFTQIGFGFNQHMKNSDDDNERESNEMRFVAGFFLSFRCVAFTGEFSWIKSISGSEPENEKYFTPGIVWRPAHSWEIGVGSPVGISRKSSNQGIILKVTREF